MLKPKTENKTPAAPQSRHTERAREVGTEIERLRAELRSIGDQLKEAYTTPASREQRGRLRERQSEIDSLLPALLDEYEELSRFLRREAEQRLEARIDEEMAKQADLQERLQAAARDLERISTGLARAWSQYTDVAAEVSAYNSRLRQLVGVERSGMVPQITPFEVTGLPQTVIHSASELATAVESMDSDRVRERAQYGNSGPPVSERGFGSNAPPAVQPARSPFGGAFRYVGGNPDPARLV